MNPLMYDAPRFYGELPASTIWGHCGHCGGRIDVGDTYHTDGEMKICGECYRRFKPMMAEKENRQYGTTQDD
jgi:recombinational DNA repair protein (RecF pathway)